MVYIRFFNVNAIVRNITVAKHGCFGVALRREKHLLIRNGSLNVIYPNSGELLAGLRSPNRYSVIYRLEHGAPGASANEIKQNSASASTSPPPQSAVNSSDANKETIFNDNVQSPLTQPPHGADISGNQLEAASSLSEFSLPPIPAKEEFTFLLREENLQSLGLGGFSPIGIFQEILQFLHVTFNIPWWGSIVIFTLTLKTMLLPFHIKGKRLLNDYMNKMPQFQELQKKVEEAKRTGNCYEIAAALHDFQSYAQKNNIMDIRRMLYMLINAPVFLCAFFALKRMAETPNLTSFQTGGMLWFQDLTVADQYYLLPIFSGFTAFFIMKTNITTAPTPIMKGIIYLSPILILVFMSRFPSAILCYSVASNCFALSQNLLLNWDPVQKYFNIPVVVPVTKSTTKVKGKGVISDIQTYLSDRRILQEVEDRERLNAVKFENSSSTPLKRTFKFNPTKARVLLQNKENRQN